MYFNRVNYSKYNNNKVEYNGVIFDSKKELRFFLYLKDLEKDNIVKYEIQPAFRYQGQAIRSINYIADFTVVVLDVEKFKNAIGYRDEKKGHAAADDDIKAGKTVILDTKGYKTEVYKLKYKLMLYRGHKIFEI